MAPREVVVIGTEPPCPRCALLGEMVEDIRGGLPGDFSTEHISFESERARSIARDLGLEAATAKQVAARLGTDIDWESVFALIADPPACELAGRARGESARKWSPALDEALRELQESARAVGILMTPVLVVDGRVVHEGSVPSVPQVRAWLETDCGREDAPDKPSEASRTGHTPLGTI